MAAERGLSDVWARPGLSPRDRRLITVAALVALNRTDQLRTHPGRALENGVTQEELVEAITHLAFYAGWPCAVAPSARSARPAVADLPSGRGH